MNIDILIGDNRYATAAYFSQALGEALERQGAKTRLFWVGEGQFFHAFYEIMADPPDFTCSFSDISLEKQPLGDLWHIPHFSLLVDPPIYFLHQLRSKYGWVSCVDEKDCAFVRALNFSRVFFLPHAADAKLKTPVRQQRHLEATFFGTCIDYEAVARAWPEEEKELLMSASEKVLSRAGLSIVQALVELGVRELDLPRYHHEVDLYTRGKDRVELSRSLKGHRVHIWGEGPWEKYLPHHPIYPPLSFDQTLEMMKKSKVVLNSSPRFKSGAHERIFYALMCGASVYTGENDYLKTHLPEVLTYRFGEWETPCFKNWQESAEEGQKRVLAAHTWDARAATLLDLFWDRFLSCEG
jgi:spore maturation protein CgeB